ncbi:hypothetical protein ACUNV4_02130 [Granulosicoccus sp. 3-233]|uniref:hypothetical protein n=1 Tax=Granulosicoccus sp. 3-233 TaxID=3417969 RepID=UPI003D34C2F2
MSSIYVATLFSCLIATAVFAAGYFKGISEAIADHRTETDSPIPDEKESNYGLAIMVAVIVASSIICLIGIVPEMIYAGPFLAIVTAVMNGVAFFVDSKS